ncbi:di-N-acetylchitobiase-like [Leucoraja erinacea]|uniref:di-N-acetylchitobiase-like n=1 Tax=Leucoraja erinaceus TaxID=7782 RepID=UPI0024574117|nr:di-N-acetylchitobiase-like [Leucoraja erinacea]
MRWRLESVLTLVINTLWMQNIVTDRDVCKCKNQTLCKPISSSHRVQVEVFGFHIGTDRWVQYHWPKITTIVVSGAVEDKFYCIVHSYNIRLVLKADITMYHLRDNATMELWKNHIVVLVRTYNLDGIYIHFSGKLNKGTWNYHELTRMVIKSASHFRNELPGCQISFAVPWTPSCKKERCYDFLAIAHVIDFFFVESFKIPNDKREGCVATSSSPYHHVLTGLSDYIKMGVDSRKLVMGVAWYGYDYTCKSFSKDGTCELEIGSHKDPCSYKVAKLMRYKDIVKHLPRSLTGKVWNDVRKAPYFVFMDGKTYHQVWYDDPESISMKSTFLKKLKLGGIGVVKLNDLDHNRTAWATLHAEEMWNALCPP